MLPKQGKERLRLEWFSEVAKRSAGARTFGEHVVVRGDEDDRRRDAFCLEHISKIEPGQSPEVDVEDDAFRIARNVAMEVFLRGAEGLDADPIDPKRARKRHTQGVIVVDDADPRVLAVLSCWAGVLESCHANPDGGHKPYDPWGADAFYWTLGQYLTPIGFTPPRAAPFPSAPP